jgi:hypothetical protein
MRIHILKTWSPWFELVRDGKKPWELRLNDRNYRRGDFLVLRQFEPDPKGLRTTALGRCPHPDGKWGNDYVVMAVTWVIEDLFVPPGYVMLSLREATDQEFVKVMGRVTTDNEGGIWSGVGELGVPEIR